MRYACLAALSIFLVLVIPLPAHAYLSEWTMDISLNDDKTTDWTVTYYHNETVKQSDVFLLAGVLDYNVTADGNPISCSILSNIGSSIVCNNINAQTIIYHIKTFPLIRSLQSLSTFTSRFSVIQPTGKFTVIIRLPFGTAFAESSKLSGTGLNPFEPQGAQQKSDGRRIFAEWVYDMPKLGETTDFTVVYEPVKPADFNVFIFIITGIVIVFLIVLVLFFRRHRIEEILPVLTDSERKVMEIVLRDKKVDQRLIVKETDFSKAKASRVIQDLKKRGLIEKRQKGRTNIITLNKTRSLQKNDESAQKKGESGQKTAEKHS